MRWNNKVWPYSPARFSPAVAVLPHYWGVGEEGGWMFIPHSTAIPHFGIKTPGFWIEIMSNSGIYHMH